jgi:hypothetical protein
MKNQVNIGKIHKIKTPFVIKLANNYKNYLKVLS